MIRKAKENRPRLLLITGNQELRSCLVTLLTGYGYYVDYEESRREGIRKYMTHKHTIVVMDVPTLPRIPGRVTSVFSYFKRLPIILVAAYADERLKLEPYYRSGVIFDRIYLPVDIGQLQHVLTRVVKHNKLLRTNEFLSSLALLVCITTPLWIGAFVSLLK
ncbi:MAG: hypothetical protein GF398_10740 [Chitinivibrionales bacterium]|nr:hypothetical protein [Chitinivibrionales bacterium]